MIDITVEPAAIQKIFMWVNYILMHQHIENGIIGMEKHLVSNT